MLKTLIKNVINFGPAILGFPGRTLLIGHKQPTRSKNREEGTSYINWLFRRWKDKTSAELENNWALLAARDKNQ